MSLWGWTHSCIIFVLQSADGPDLTDTPVALLTVVTDDTTDSALFSPESICIVVEDEILVNGPTNLAESFLLLFGYIYALDLQYPKKLELTFTFIQKVVMCLEDNKPLKGRLLMLKNDLFNEWITQNGLLVKLSIEEAFLFVFFLIICLFYLTFKMNDCSVHYSCLMFCCLIRKCTALMFVPYKYSSGNQYCFFYVFLKKKVSCSCQGTVSVKCINVLIAAIAVNTENVIEF